MSHLGRLQPREPTDPEVIRRKAGRFWREFGGVLLRIDELRDDWLRQRLTNEMIERHGPRQIERERR